VDEEHQRDRDPIVELGEDDGKRTDVGVHLRLPDTLPLSDAESAPARSLARSRFPAMQVSFFC
jgi:hypothetical protein